VKGRGGLCEAAKRIDKASGFQGESNTWPSKGGSTAARRPPADEQKGGSAKGGGEGPGRLLNASGVGKSITR